MTKDGTQEERSHQDSVLSYRAPFLVKSSERCIKIINLSLGY